MSLRKNGAITPLGQPQTFQVVSIRKAPVSGESQADRVAFFRQVKAMESKVGGWIASIDELSKNLPMMKEVLMGGAPATSALYTRAEAIEKLARRIRDRLATNPQRRALGAPGPVSIGFRLSIAGSGERTSASGPTATQRESFAIAREELQKLEAQLDRIFKSSWSS